MPFVVPNVLGPDACGSSAWGRRRSNLPPGRSISAMATSAYWSSSLPSMKAWVDYIRATGEERNLWDTGFHFGDWLALDAHPKDGQESYTGLTDVYYIASAFYLYSISMVVKVAQVLGRAKDEKYYSRMYEKVLKHIRREYFTPTGRLAVNTQTAHVLALQFGIAPEEYIQRTVDTLVKLLEKNDYHLDTGFVGTPYLLLVLSDHGYHDVACRVFMQKDYPSWLYPITKGATTIWEHWDGIRPDGSFWSDAMNSYNHYAYGCIAEWMTRYAVGLDLDDTDPAYHHSILHPRFVPQLTWAKASLETSYGRLSLHWEREDDVMRMQVEVPENTWATLILEQATLEGLTESDKSIPQVLGVREGQLCEEGVELILGSGQYSFKYALV